ncbi:MAG: rRNA pseudouridine synthase [Chitinophagales bacterium]|nr:rRNA pseudouridine synthase [Chitinophagales bacterium]
MEEEKKRRPRLTRPDGDSSLEERKKSEHNDDPFAEPFDKPTERPDRGSYERKPWQDRNQGGGGGYERKPWQDRNQGGQGGGGYERKPWQDRNQGGQGGGGYERKPWQDRNQGGQGGGGYERKPWQDRNQGGDQGGERRPWQDRNQGGGGGYERKPWQDRNQGGGGGYERKPWQDRGQGGGGQGGERRPWQDRNQGEGGERRPWQDRGQGGGGGYERRPYQQRGGGGGGGFRKPFGQRNNFRNKNEFYVERKPKPDLPTGEGMPLNKYLAHCGLSSRRKAVEFVEGGKVTVNGEVKLEPFYRVQAGDVVMCDGQPMKVQERMVYVLLNKPKNVITTTDDDRGRPTVLDIVDPNFPERLFPVGRLDRDTTGLILLTNDGDLAQKLTHPSYSVQKQYRVGLRRGLTQEDLEHIERGVMLDDGLMEVNWIRFSEDHPERDIVELEISSGRNRVVRRIFETLGYEIFKLDRFYFAGLTKKDLERGKFRELTQREVMMLKHFTGHPSTAKKKRPSEDMPDMEDDAPEIG